MTTQQTHDVAGTVRKSAKRSAGAERRTFDEAARTARLVTDQTAEAVEQTARAGVETAQKTVASGLNAATDLAQRSTDQVLKTFGDFGKGGEALARRSSQNPEAITKANSILVRGFQDLSREWLGLPQALLQRNIERYSALLGCRSAEDIVAVQGDFARDNLQAMVDSGQRIAEVSTRVTSEAARAMTSRQAA